MRRLRIRRFAYLVTALIIAVPASTPAQSFVNFESGQVRPLALSSDGQRLFAVNTPDNRLAIFDVTPAGLTLVAEVSVGLEPVAVATRSNLAGHTEAWVVNHLSDSVSIVDIDPTNVALARVTRTLLVGDEPRDIVFAGSAGTRAFVTAAHRGQNRPGDPQLTTEGIGRADIWAFDANNLGAALGGTPLSIIQAFGDTPRALAKSPSGATVYAAVFHSGSRTTTVLQPLVAALGGLPPPPLGATPGAPSTGLIVKFKPASGHWEDEIARSWDAGVFLSLPDQDVFLIDADHNPPQLAAGSNAVVGVGTTLFNMAVRPTNGKVFVSNTAAQNEIRFEPVLTGDLTESRVTVIAGTTSTPVHLNPHINYAIVPGPQSEIDQSLAFPTDLTFSSDGATLYVAAFGSGKVGVYDAADLEAGTVTVDQVEVGGGPSGLALDETNDRLYVMNRFDQTISIVTNVGSPALRAATATASLHYDPEPAEVRNGRRFLYDARATSGHGDQACASCHIFGDLDGLAWDLGDPFGSVVPNPNPFRVGSANPVHPMKGPMTTQSLRGMAGAGPMHWRGDRTGGSVGGDPLDEDLAFKQFNPAFVSLLGRAAELTPAEDQVFTDFILTVRYPPNPIRALTNVLSGSESSGRTFFLNTPTDGSNTCDFCHRLPLGTDGLSSIEGETQEFKIPHLRNAYQKIGMFGFPQSGNLGDQVRGFGFLHDGGVPTLFDFINPIVFQNTTTQLRRDLEAFILGLDAGLAPIVGQQVSMTSSPLNDAGVLARVDLMLGRADAGECDVVVKGVASGEMRGYLYVGSNSFEPDRNGAALVSKTSLRTLAATAGQEHVYTAVPPGSGLRIGIDRDDDGYRDRTELDLGSDPGNPASVPPGAPTRTPTPTPTPTLSPTPTATSTPPGMLLTIRATTLKLKDGSLVANPLKRRFTFMSKTNGDPVPNQVGPPLPGTAGDPTIGGATLTVYNAAGTGEIVVMSLPAANWRLKLNSHLSASYDYRGPLGAAVQRIVVKDGQLRITAGKNAWQYTLDEPQQGVVAVRLALGTGVTWCASGPARANGTPPSTAAFDHVDSFTAQPKSPPPAVCPPP